MANVPFAAPSNIYGRTSDTVGAGAGQRLAATTGVLKVLTNYGFLFGQAK